MSPNFSKLDKQAKNTLTSLISAWEKPHNDNDFTEIVKLITNPDFKIIISKRLTLSLNQIPTWILNAWKLLHLSATIIL